MNIYNTYIPEKIKVGELVEGQFVITGEGKIVPIKGVEKIRQMLGFDGRNPKQLGALLAKLEASAQRNPNTDYAVDHAFAVLDVDKKGVTQKVRESTRNLMEQKLIDNEEHSQNPIDDVNHKLD